MISKSILFDENEHRKDTTRQPACFTDLFLDQVIDAISASKADYHLKPFFYQPLGNVETLRYRQAVMQDMENDAVKTRINAFAQSMVTVRRHLEMVKKLGFEYHSKGWFLESALLYCDTVTSLAQDLNREVLQSRGLKEMGGYAASYCHTPAFQDFQAQARHLKTALSEVKYSVLIKTGEFKVRRYAGEGDYSLDIENTFEKFKQGAVKDYRVKLPDRSGMNHIEAKILEFVARLYPEPFAELDRFYEQHSRFVDETLEVFARESQFYVAYLEFIGKFKRKGLPFCYPQMGNGRADVYVHDSFDLALARRLQDSATPVVRNDFFLKVPERIIVVSGPNQGGKTTFARMFGQLHYLAALGCPVPGRRARLSLCGRIYTHFEKQEDLHNLRGKLQDDLVRIHGILDHCQPNSILILNEIFASTTLQDAIFMSKAIMARVVELGVLCVWVTFLDELATVNEKTVSMVSTVLPDNPTVRTFKIKRKPADGLAYALSIAEKHRLSYEAIRQRIGS